MDDLELTRKCAEACGWSGWRSKHGYWNVTDPDGKNHVCCNDYRPFDPYTGEKLPEPTLDHAIAECGFDPLHDNAQMAALVKKFRLGIEMGEEGEDCYVWTPNHDPEVKAWNLDLNRAVCECVAQLSKPA